MGLFDDLFKSEKNGIDKMMDDAFQNIAMNNPIMKKAKAHIEEAANSITKELEGELGEEGNSQPKEEPSVMDHFEERSRTWDSLIDRIAEKELSQYKVCPECGEAVPADRVICPYCNTKLPEHTADVWICPDCGAKNRTLSFYCENCGKERMEFDPESDGEKKE